ncbi:PREDICTED: protein Flattop homolog [Branchiostoma belcheri]|uniref:Protein Flattop n=1 Tax=Branchiostoma belcheri TaxID=7741 RepID=A0A6P4ZMD2_BRABE|nr:PREDICTED: protein Flattop homolog [Branchiostoma belcheri]KAI8481287.1 hypothetical protein Bbelb_409810 [Branchiostoma belcheri]
MACHFSANQYQNAFDPKRLQNWNVPSSYKERPTKLEGFTQIVANNRGHLLPGVPRSATSPWGTFLGTWDMPKSIPPCPPTSLTARSSKAAEKILAAQQRSKLNTASNGFNIAKLHKLELRARSAPPKLKSPAPERQKSATPTKAPSPVAPERVPTPALEKVAEVET